LHHLNDEPGPPGGMRRTLQKESPEDAGERRFSLSDSDAASFLPAVTIVISDIHNLPVDSSKSPLTLSSP
jgi:hypothetical protein